MKRNMIDWKNAVLRSKERKAMPIMTYPGLEIVRKSIMEMVTRGEVQYHCIKALSDIYPIIASATLIMELSAEAEAFGSDVIYHDNEIPTVIKPFIRSFDHISELRIPDIGRARTGEYLKAAQLTVQNITDRPVMSGIIGPFTLAGRLYDIAELMTAILMKPDESHQLLEKSVSFLKKYAKAFKDVGCNGVVIAEPAAGLLSSEQCEEFSSKYIKMIVEHVQDESFMVVLHNCGNTRNLVDSMVSTGCMGFHFGNAVNMENILPQVPADRLVFGNIDPAGILKNGSAEIIKTKTLELLQKTSSYHNFILSSGCDIPPGTPLSNIDAFFQALQMYNKNIV
jgi:uroporphyrinogen decarboxylase